MRRRVADALPKSSPRMARRRWSACTRSRARRRARPGARMVVRPDGAFHGTIGGGQLEMEMLAIAGEMLGAGGPSALLDQALGPDLGQCCGGRVKILIETFDARDIAQIERARRGGDKGPFVLECRVHGGRVRRESSSSVRRQLDGVARDPWGEPDARHAVRRRACGARAGAGAGAAALFGALVRQPAGGLPAAYPAEHEPVASRIPRRRSPKRPPDALVLVMTHDHPLDLAITAAALSAASPMWA